MGATNCVPGRNLIKYITKERMHSGQHRINGLWYGFKGVSYDWGSLKIISWFRKKECIRRSNSIVDQGKYGISDMLHASYHGYDHS